MKTKILLGGILLFASFGVCQGGWFENTLENAGKRLGNKAVNEAGDAAYDKAKGNVRDNKKKPAADTKSSSKDATATGSDKSGYQYQDKSSTSWKSGQQDENVTASPGGNPLGSEQPVSIEQAELVYTKFDFVPGDKVIFFDDFSDTDVGEFPRKWTFDGPKSGGNNTVDVVEFQGKRFLRSVPGAKSQAPATQYLRLDQKGDFPEKFTIEFDAVFSAINNSPVYYITYKVLLVPNDKKVDIFKRATQGAVSISGQDNISANTSTKVQLNDGKVHHVAISVNGTFVKAYIDNQRVINDPDGIKRPLKQIGIQMHTPNNFRSDKLLFTNFRLAAGGKDIKSALDTDGRIVTHGILFDTGKDIIKPESLPTLKMIYSLLNDDPSLKFAIEGHTDNQGNKGINQPLSEKRAAAVKNWLVGKGIDSSRLTSQGFGDSKPIDSNKTLEGRANNRRVEFAKF